MWHSALFGDGVGGSQVLIVCSHSYGTLWHYSEYLNAPDSLLIYILRSIQNMDFISPRFFYFYLTEL